MIHTLELVGFKSFVANELEFGGLTLLTGINSSGKSSVIQAL
ncbi:MAG: AAA family ATPase, partial [Bacteroidota bacterium]